MALTIKSCEEYIELLSSSDPVPGGGGASAVVGAMGVALGNMVGSLTVGKKKYADVEDEVIELKKSADKLQNELIELAEKDATGFIPLSQAYGLPSGTDEEKKHKQKVMEEALRVACEAPLAMMEKCCEGILLHERMGAIGTAIAISDIGVGVLFCKAALKGASLNVRINTKSMKDREYAEELNSKVQNMIETYSQKADDIYNGVARRFD